MKRFNGGRPEQVARISASGRERSDALAVHVWMPPLHLIAAASTIMDRSSAIGGHIHGSNKIKSSADYCPTNDGLRVLDPGYENSLRVTRNRVSWFMVHSRQEKHSERNPAHVVASLI